MTNDIRPVFILSLPRSGSTLLQRVLIGHPAISTSAEPWLVLNHLTPLLGDRIKASYSSTTAAVAHREFIERAGGEAVYHEALSQFFHKLYSSARKGDARYFIDKTPRYYCILPHLARIFPDARFIFLFRHPLAVHASIMTTWSKNGYRRIYRFHTDIYQGPDLLAAGQRELGEKAVSVRYEDFVSDPETSLREICEYLGLKWVRENFLGKDPSQVKGTMGDKTGVVDYTTITPESLDKWKKIFSTSYRRRLAVRYLQGISEETLATMGYDKNTLLKEASAIPITWSPGLKDRACRLYSHWMSYYFQESPLKRALRFLRGQREYPFD